MTELYILSKFRGIAACNKPQNLKSQLQLPIYLYMYVCNTVLYIIEQCPIYIHALDMYEA